MVAKPAHARAVLDAAIDIALPVSGGTVRKRLKQLRRALADVDAARAAHDAAHRAGQSS